MINQISIKTLTEKEKGYILGIYKGDGYIHHDKKYRHYTIEFYLDSIRNKMIQNYLISVLIKLGLKPSIRKDKRFNCNKIRIRSKILYEHIVSEKYHNNDDFKIGFISGLFDAEGYADFKRSSTNIVNTDFELVDRCKKYLSHLGINSTLKTRKKSKKDKKISYILHISQQVKALNSNSVKLNNAT